VEQQPIAPIKSPMDPMKVPLEALIEKRHADRTQWATIRELRAGVGFSHRGVDRRIDLAVFNCWPSKGLVRIAYEMKRSRGDFMREIDNPQKREWVEANFHQTYFVVSQGVCKPEEVPESWGLFVATKNGDKLRRLKVAQHREIESLPELVALSAIRALAEENQKLSLRHYYYEGMWIQQHQLDEMVKDAIDGELGFERANLAKTIENNFAEVVQAKEWMKALKAPFEVLARAIGDNQRLPSYNYFGRPIQPITVKEVEAWIERVRCDAMKPLLKQLQHCADNIEMVMRKAREEKLDGGGDEPLDLIGQHKPA
jgi:hypothetical protein